MKRKAADHVLLLNAILERVASKVVLDVLSKGFGINQENLENVVNKQWVVPFVEAYIVTHLPDFKKLLPRLTGSARRLVIKDEGLIIFDYEIAGLTIYHLLKLLAKEPIAICNVVGNPAAHASGNGIVIMLVGLEILGVNYKQMNQGHWGELRQAVMAPDAESRNLLEWIMRFKYLRETYPSRNSVLLLH